MLSDFHKLFYYNKIKKQWMPHINIIIIDDYI